MHSFTLKGTIRLSEKGETYDVAPFTLTIEDDCCEGHAESRGRSILDTYVKAESKISAQWGETYTVAFEGDE